MTARADSPTTPSSGWFKSTFSPSQSSCVEVCFTGSEVQIRDTKDRERGPVICVALEYWDEVLADAVGDRQAGAGVAVRIERLSDGGTRIRSLVDDIVLTFNAGEWTAFVEGIKAGQFTAPVITSSEFMCS